MRKAFKKLLATTFAGMFALTATVGLNTTLDSKAAQDVSGLADGTAYLNINNADWSEFEAEWTNAEITGDGSYTVAMKATEGQSLAQFNALEVVNGEATLGTGCVLTVDSIKINGEDVELQGSSYTCSADGGGVTTRVNIYNEWNAPDETAVAGDDEHVDHRVAEGSVMDATACLFSNEYVDSSSGSGFKVESIEVNFTVSGFGETAGAGAPSETPEVEGPAIAHLVINNADWTEFEAEYVDAEITGDGDYQVSMKATEGQSLAQFNALQVENGELLMGPATVLTVTRIEINGEEVELQGKSFTCSADGGGVTTRVNLYNEWNAPDETAVAGDDEHIDHRVAEGSVMDATACLFSNEYVDSSSGSGFKVESIVVDFTVTNYGGQAAAGDAPELEEIDLNKEYHAYLFLQGPKYTFRDKYDNDTTGFGTACFDQVNLQGDTSGAAPVAATINDATIDGDGTYTVSITGIEWPADEFEAQDYLNLLGVSFDIPNNDKLTISDVKLTIGGNEIDQKALIMTPELDSKAKYLDITIQNIYDKDHPEVQTIGYYATPCTDISVTFTISGFGHQGTAVAPADGATADDATQTSVDDKKDDKKDDNNTTIIIIIIVAVVVVIAAVVGVVLGKKKKNK